MPRPRSHEMNRLMKGAFSLSVALASLVLLVPTTPAHATTLNLTVATGSQRGVTVNLGDTAEWDWSSGGTSHTVTSGTCSASSPSSCLPDGNFTSAILTSGSFSHAFSTPGVFPYYCGVHGASERGTITVTVGLQAGACPADMAPVS